MITFVCKYTPIELFAGFHVPCAVFDEQTDSYDRSDAAAHANLCGFGKALMEQALAGKIDELVLVNCCDVMRRAYDVLKSEKVCKFLWLMDLPHSGDECARERLAGEIRRLYEGYQSYSGLSFDKSAFEHAFLPAEENSTNYIAILGARCPQSVVSLAENALRGMPVRNLACVGNRQVVLPEVDSGDLFLRYAETLLTQIPCRRMADSTGRRALLNDPYLKGIIYHTQRFCDYYSMEFAALQRENALPMIRVETDYTRQSAGQLITRLEAFGENLRPKDNRRLRKDMDGMSGKYFAGVDSGSTSTDVVIIDGDGNCIASVILPTAGNIRASAEEALQQALKQAELSEKDIAHSIATGYGRQGLHADEQITEITCHARGAKWLYPSVRTIIDIGGQDSKVIHLNEKGKVINFAMNDKCAAGTGRFLEAMARALNLPLNEMSRIGLAWKEPIIISSMCTVFAESEVVSLVAEEKSKADIVHGLNQSIAVRIDALVSRAGGEAPYMITGGVAQNEGVVKAIEERLNASLYVCPEAQICGAYGAALFASGKSM